MASMSTAQIRAKKVLMRGKNKEGFFDTFQTSREPSGRRKVLFETLPMAITINNDNGYINDPKTGEIIGVNRKWRKILESGYPELFTMSQEEVERLGGFEQARPQPNLDPPNGQGTVQEPPNNNKE